MRVTQIYLSLQITCLSASRVHIPSIRHVSTSHTISVMCLSTESALCRSIHSSVIERNENHDVDAVGKFICVYISSGNALSVQNESHSSSGVAALASAANLSSTHPMSSGGKLGSSCFPSILLTLDTEGSVVLGMSGLPTLSKGVR